MRTLLKTSVAAVAAAALCVTAVAAANADTLTNNVGGSASVVTVAPGGTATVSFKLNANSTPTGDPAGCDAGGRDKATLTVSSSSYTGLKIGNAASGPYSVAVQNCKKSTSVSFVVAAAGTAGRDFAISAAVTDGVTGSHYTVSNAGFTLRVVANVQQTSLTISPATASAGYGATSVPLSATLTSGSPAAPVAGKTISFGVDGAGVGTAVTNASGVATLPVPIGTAYPVADGYETSASFAGDTGYAGSSSLGALNITPATQSALVITGPTSGSYGQTLPITSSGGSGTGATTYGASGTACTLSQNGTSVVITSGTGTCTLTASKAADGTYTEVSAAPVPLSVSKVAQTPLSVDSPTSGAYGDVKTITTSGGSGVGALSFSTAGSTACQVPTSGGNAGKLVITSGTGSCSLTASKAADADYTAATSAPLTVVIGKASQTLTVTGPTTGTFGDLKDIEYTSGAGTGAVSFDAGDSTACAIENGHQLRITSGTGTCSVVGSQAADDNYAATTSASLSVTPDKAPATLQVSDATATYDGGSHAVTVTSDHGALTGMTVTYDGSSVAPTHAGSYAVVVSLDNPDYTATEVHDSLVISPKPLTGAITASDKEYDGSTGAHAEAAPLSGVVGEDQVGLQVGSASFDTKDIGPTKLVTAGIALTGDDAADYALTSSSATATAAITPRQVTGHISADDKTYDRTAVASAQPSGLDRALPGVELSVDSAAFDDALAGTGKTVTAQLSLTGTDAANYALTSGTATALAAIHPKALSATITAADKVYDGGTAADVTPHLSGVIGTDDVTATATDAVFGDRDAGPAKAVTATLSITGYDAANYSLVSSPYATKAAITPKAVTGTITADDKAYDGSAAAAVHAVNPLSGVILGDAVALGASGGQFDSKDVGTGKSVSASLALTGNQAGNYRLSSTTATATASVTPMQLAITASSAAVVKGAGVPPISAGFAAFAPGDSASVLTTAPTCSTTYTPQSAVGSYPTTCAGAVAANYTFTYVPGTVTVGYGYSPLLAPINTDRSSSFKLGSTIPVKFQLLDANKVVQDAPGQAFTLKVVKIDSTPDAAVNEAVLTNAGDAGNAFRWDTSGKLYIFNLSTKTAGLTEGTYRLDVCKGNEVVASGYINVKK